MKIFQNPVLQFVLGMCFTAFLWYFISEQENSLKLNHEHQLQQMINRAVAQAMHDHQITCNCSHQNTTSRQSKNPEK